MTDPAPLRAIAHQMFRAALAAVDPADALRHALARHPVARPDPGGRLIVLAFGKAAMPMARAAMAALDPGQVLPPDQVLVVTNYENATPLPGATVMAAGHPVPDAAGERAAQAVLALLDAAGPADRIVALVSGGASALLPAPVPGLTLADKAAVNRALLAGGLDIGQMNLIRQHLSQLKGGGFLRRAAPARVTAFILSDVIGDDLRVIASGPTVAPIGTQDQAVALLRDHGLWDGLPNAVRDHLSGAAPEAPPLPPVENHLIASNRIAAEAALAACPIAPARLDAQPLVGDVAEAAARIVAAAKDSPRPACLIWGGETTVTLTGTGKGGRNQDLALRLALSDLSAPWAFLSGGTDGRDGPTEAAGGLTDHDSAARMRTSGADPVALLANNDSNAALAASGDLLVTGATGTNVADLQILILG